MSTDEGDVAMRVGRNLRSIREKRGLSQNEMAKVIGMDLARYGRIERGLVNLKLQSVERLADRLGVDPLDFFR